MGRSTMTREEAEASLAQYRARHKGMSRVRKAYAALGDDATLTRFVKEKGGEIQEPGPRQLHLGNLRHKAFEEGRSLFQKTVREPDEVTNLLVSGHMNVKIGRDVRKGWLKGYWIYTLTLEERVTCPSSCFHWTTCYGNNMPWAKRIRHGQALTAGLQRELAKLLSTRGRRGVLVRLHALGDFYSPEYVHFWKEQLRQYPNLAVFGYTARRPWDPIGMSIQMGKEEFGRRFAIRWSDGAQDHDATVPIRRESECPPSAFVCPEQTGKSLCCATCGACWSTPKNVEFIEH